MDERDNYGYGYSPAGERFYDLKSGRRQGRINMIAGYRDGELIAPFTVEGACNRSVFETWLETCLIPVLRPGELVIVDNATFHHGGRIAQGNWSGRSSVGLPASLFARPKSDRKVLGMVEKQSSQVVTQIG